jgi:hypothetical protein
MLNTLSLLTRVSLRDGLGFHRTSEDLTIHLREAMEWLCRAQDASGTGGVARSYSLRFMRSHNRLGWLAAYPETTGYIIPTFFNYAAETENADYRRRAVRMAEWEVDVQMDCGAVQGGVIGFPPTPAIFNTGQVLFGWVRAAKETRDERFERAVIKAANFLVKAQDGDGAWRRNGSKYARPGVNVYDARTAWGLIETFKITGDEKYRKYAMRNLSFVLTRQLPNGWFSDCCLDDNERPLLHTLAYTMEGLLEAGVILNEARYIDASRRAADALLPQQREDGSLAGRFDQYWRPAAKWSCLTGDAQTSLVWLRLFELTREKKYYEAARRMNRFLMKNQQISAKNPGVRGGIKGSYPIWGEYAPYEYPNWAAKFFVDALSLENNCTRLVGTSGNSDRCR